MEKKLNQEDKLIINGEENILKETIEQINQLVSISNKKLASEESRSRDLTSEIVATRRIEDRVQLYSDEAISHALKDQKKDEIAILNKMLKKPYFARVVVEEEKAGKAIQYEYRIGHKTNLESRIIDWRTAPIAKLYYEYREGDEYDEEIQGKERLGKIVLRNRLDINNGKLQRIYTSKGNFEKKAAEWIKIDQNTKSFARSYSTLPSILSLITAEQFKLITENAEAPVFVQGVAGSGKTVVALHRISWLVSEKNISPKNCTCLAKSKLLASYLKNSALLVDSDLEEMNTKTYSEWVENHIKDIFPKISRPISSSPSSILRVKNSTGFLRMLEECTIQGTKLTSESMYELVLKILSNPNRIIELDDSKLLNKELISSAANHTKKNFENGEHDEIDDVIFLRILQINGILENKKPDHIFTDEIQDFSLLELATIINAVKDRKNLTLVGDTSQSINDAFPGWNKLIKLSSNQSEEEAKEQKLIYLNISHRSTIQIMQLAEHIKGSAKIISNGRAGRTPIFFKCGTETQAFSAMTDWLKKAIDRYPNAVTAVLCKNQTEVKYLFSLLQPTFGQSVRVLDQNSMLAEEGLAVATIADIKGLEFCNVVIWNPSSLNYTHSDIDRNLLYTGATRAEENLCIVGYRSYSSLLPGEKTSILRVFNMSEE